MEQVKGSKVRDTAVQPSATDAARVRPRGRPNKETVSVREAYSPLEVARILGYHRNTIYEMVHSGILPAVTPRGARSNIRILRRSVDALLNAAAQEEPSSR